VEAIRAGDHSAWSELLSGYQDRLFSVCLRMLGDREMAADLTHDAMIRVMENIERYDGRAKLSTWVIRITMNLCLSKLRSEKHRRHASLEGMAGGRSRGKSGSDRDGAPQRFEPADREPGTVSGVESGEQARFVAEALQEIPPEYRAILVLRDVQGLDYEQIAESLDIRLGTVKSRIFRARAALRQETERLMGLDGASAGGSTGRAKDGT